MFDFTITAKQKKTLARVGEFTTPHGKLYTPELAFVATEGEIKSIPKEILPTLSANLIIVNTLHLWVKCIINKSEDVFFETIAWGPSGVRRSKKTTSSFTNIHDYANFQKPIMSDSGGFQVFSMGFGKAHGIGKIANIFPEEKSKFQSASWRNQNDKNNPLKITEKGVEFIFNNKKLLLTPEKSIELQQKIGADIIFAFDECTSPLNSKKYTREAMERTHRWVKRCIKAKNTASSIQANNQALFTIVQGGYFEDLRKQSAKYMVKQNVAGFGIGGSLGKTKKDMHQVLEWTIPYLPDDKPRHLLGIGQVRDIFEAVERGVDLFDCVIPTREARHKVLYTKHGKIQLRKMKNVNEIIEKNCRCQACQEKITLYKLYELYKLKDPRAFFYATVHNIQFYYDLMKSVREAIEGNKFFKLKEKYLKYY